MYEYRVIPAPLRGKKAKGLKTSSDRFSFALQEVMNEQSAEGWEYHRAETLPFEERSRMGRKSSGFQSVLIFRRLLLEEEAENIPAEPSYAPPRNRCRRIRRTWPMPLSLSMTQRKSPPQPSKSRCAPPVRLGCAPRSEAKFRQTDFFRPAPFPPAPVWLRCLA